MSRPVKRHLLVGNAPEVDEGQLIIRMHPEDMPKGIKWNTYINLSANNSKITCKVRSNETVAVSQPRVHQININRALRERLLIRTGAIYNFYINKAPLWRIPPYVMKYHPDINARKKMRIKVLGAVALTIVIAIGLVIYFTL